MAHFRLLFVGGRSNLDNIYDNCPDSSSETAAEMAFGADWIEDYDRLNPEQKSVNWTTNDFTKDNKELYQQILDGYWGKCYDIRDINHYGSFDCINCPDFEPYKDDRDWEEKDRRNRQRIIRDIQKLPNGTLFHFADSHW